MNASLSTAALSAYLKPLLNKHALGQPLTYDDLMQSWDAAMQSAGADVSVQKQLQSLHDSQVQEYTQVAQQALHDYAQTVELVGMGDTDTEQLYIDKCLSALQIPDWNIPDVHERVTSVVQQRAIQAWQAQVAGDDDLEEEGDEEDDIKNDSEDVAEDESGEAPGATSVKNKRKNLLGVKKVRKKGTSAKTTLPKGANRGGRKPGPRSRRGGRGGAATKA